MEELSTSVALCTYNGAQFLPEQLESIAAQTLLPAELVICDDGSSDQTISIIQDFSRRASFRVRVEINQKNVGSTRNFEKAIQLCRGDLIALCDQDDIWHPEKLAVITKSFEEHAEAGYVFSDAELIDESGRPSCATLWHSVGFTGSAKHEFTSSSQVAALLKRSFVTGATMCFRATLVSAAVPFSEHLVHDYWISVLASSVGESGLPIPQKLVSYRQHRNQQIGARRKSIRERLAMLRTVNSDECERARRGLEDLLKRLHMVRKPALPCHDLILHLIMEKAEHCERRVAVHRSHGISRVVPIFSEVINGRYVRFSNSWRSVIADLCF